MNKSIIISFSLVWHHFYRAKVSVGILSLLDVLLGVEMQQIVDKLGIPDDMSQALLYREGRLGHELQLAEESEKGNMIAIQAI